MAAVSKELLTTDDARVHEQLDMLFAAMVAFDSIAYSIINEPHITNGEQVKNYVKHNKSYINKLGKKLMINYMRSYGYSVGLMKGGLLKYVFELYSYHASISGFSFFDTEWKENLLKGAAAFLYKQFLIGRVAQTTCLSERRQPQDANAKPWFRKNVTLIDVCPFLSFLSLRNPDNKLSGLHRKKMNNEGNNSLIIYLFFTHYYS